MSNQYSRSATHYRAEDISLTKYRVNVSLDEDLNKILTTISNVTKQTRSEIMRLALGQFQSKRLALLDKYKLEG